MQTHADALKRQLALASTYKPLLTDYLQALVQGKAALYQRLTPEFAKRLSGDPKRFSENDRVLVTIWELWEGQSKQAMTLVILGVREQHNTVELWLREELLARSEKQLSSVKSMTLHWERKQTWRKTAQGWRLSAVEKAKTPKNILLNAQLRISLPSTDRV
ncbi:hypothetical protein [Armatimonas sp.]|uniref:hypothetical protein n=1 Tax=Armatimonas sp. TaxID=1872638 RepID=UPI00286B7AA2|nr:hypothetical protein [Armatimonas sp.]